MKCCTAVLIETALSHQCASREVVQSVTSGGLCGAWETPPPSFLFLFALRTDCQSLTTYNHAPSSSNSPLSPSTNHTRTPPDQRQATDSLLPHMTTIENLKNFVRRPRTPQPASPRPRSAPLSSLISALLMPSRSLIGRDGIL